MKIIDSFWVGQLGFVKASNGFETKIYAGIATAQTQAEAEQEIASSGYVVPNVHLANFLHIDNFSSEYQAD